MGKFSSFAFLTVCVLLLVKDNLSTPVRESEPIAGGIHHVDVYEPTVLKLVDYARKEYSQQTTYKPIVIEVSDATVQVVSGMLYRVSLTFAASTCKKEAQNKSCTELVGGKRDKCTLEVWSQPWIGSPKIKFICGNSSDNISERSLSLDI